MQHISPHLMYKQILLEDAKSIVKYSFVLEKTSRSGLCLSYLDLNLGEYSEYKKRGIRHKFICTEEDCRKYLVPERKLLYLLHLDIPRRKEDRFDDFNQYLLDNHNNPDSFHVSTISENDAACLSMILEKLVLSAFKRKQDKAKIIRWFLKIRNAGMVSPQNESKDPSGAFTYHLYFKCKNSEVVKEFLKQDDFFLMFLLKYESEVIEYFLYHARKSSYDLYEQKVLPFDFIQASLMIGIFDHVESLLKYQDAPGFDVLTFSLLQSRIIETNIMTATKEELLVPLQWMSKQRLLLMLQTIWIIMCPRGMDRLENPVFMYRDHPRDIIRWYWRSLPDPFISLAELVKAYGKIMGLERVSYVHAVYEEAMGEDVPNLAPRPLMQYCRTTIRKTLFANNHWLPDGIRQINIPFLHPFLKLER
ncbi:SOCS box domain-containing protein [Caerostris darwini]|uniref:SOCS box domain-containing protein n=1 Tax=Caerostris darwini TaxID=1538125 RepID=A0AAV4R6L7_9ARAC|nr:SOCS box domain-containing protein [Caerostris darwini]